MALSASRRLALKVALIVGVKVTEKVQLAPAFRVVPQVELETENWLAFVPVMLHEKFTSAPAPVLVTVSVFI